MRNDGPVQCQAKFTGHSYIRRKSVGSRRSSTLARGGLAPRQLQRVAQEFAAGEARDIPPLRVDGNPAGYLRKEQCNGIRGRQVPNYLHGMNSGLQRQPKLLISITIRTRHRTAIDADLAWIGALAQGGQCNGYIGE